MHVCACVCACACVLVYMHARVRLAYQLLGCAAFALSTTLLGAKACIAAHSLRKPTDAVSGSSMSAPCDSLYDARTREARAALKVLCGTQVMFFRPVQRLQNCRWREVVQP